MPALFVTKRLFAELLTEKLEGFIDANNVVIFVPFVDLIRVKIIRYLKKYIFNTMHTLFIASRRNSTVI